MPIGLKSSGRMAWIAAIGLGLAACGSGGVGDMAEPPEPPVVVVEPGDQTEQPVMVSQREWVDPDGVKYTETCFSNGTCETTAVRPPPIRPTPTPPSEEGGGSVPGVPDTFSVTEGVDEIGRRYQEVCRSSGDCRRTYIAATPMPNGPDRGTGGEQGEETSSEACTVDGMNDFAWQPPEPSTKVTIPSRLLLAGLSPDQHTLGNVGARLEDALLAAGYVEYGYQSIGCSGFAMVTRLERIDADGRPLEGAIRFAPPESKPNWSLGGYVQRLFGAPPGYYRQIVFAATDQLYDEETLAAAPTREDLDVMMAEADVQQLPDAMLERPFGGGHRLHALIYEFEKGQSERDVAQLRPSRLGGAAHIQATGIYTELGDND
ncbi:MAG: hypothetical protein AAF216_03205 [Pseudomonadota bacterium]